MRKLSPSSGMEIPLDPQDPSSPMRDELVAPAGTATSAGQPRARRGELDLLRALVVVGLVYFHTAVIFGGGEFPVKAVAENRVATVFLAFGATWGMPLLFMISGMGIWYSLRSRSPKAFVRERLRRLLVPLVVGVLTLVPLQAYLGLRRSGQGGSFAGFYRRFVDVRPSLDFPFVVKAAPDAGVFETGHLWFLVCLLAFSLVLLPGLVLLRRPRGTRLVGRLGELLARPGAVFLLALPLAAVELPLGSEVGHGAWNRYSYALLLAYGYLAAADARIGEAFRRQWRPAIAAGMLLLVAGGAMYATAAGRGDPFTATDPLSDHPIPVRPETQPTGPLHPSRAHAHQGSVLEVAGPHADDHLPADVDL